ncbi:MAG: MBL fold metallo-hydrolase [Candidatus Helarchaeota archaeon]|nr:MBL fold metallo-hydrolase [Candidatus Helarchaeota archaeon]
MTMFHEILENIYYIESKGNGKYPFANSLFINAEKKLLIDTGFGRFAIKKVLKTFGQPDIILYSHGHEDHIPLEKLFTTPLKYIHLKDKLMATSKDELFRIYGLTDNPSLLKLTDLYLKSFYYKPLTQVDTFTDGQIFDLGIIQVKTIHSPGHSAGHSVFEIINENLIFSSDIDLTSFGPWYGGLDSEIQQFQDSINLVIKKSPKIIITSHKGIFQESDVEERLKRYLNKFQEREEKILNNLERSKTLKELADLALIHGTFLEPKDFYFTAERIMLEKHLKILLENEKIEYTQGKYKTK